MVQVPQYALTTPPPASHHPPSGIAVIAWFQALGHSQARIDHIICTAELLNHCWLGAVQSAAFAARVRVERRRMLLNFILVVWISDSGW
jgi:hypothetical protein